MTTTDNPGLSRRSMLCGVLVALAVPGGLAACGTADSPGTSTPANGDTTGARETTTAPSGGGGIVALAEIPDGGGVVVAAGGRDLVITRTGTTVKAFDASCPHAGTTVSAPSGDTITCPNHGSQFAASDGAVKKGPATSGLKPVAVKVQGDQVVLA